MAQNRFKSKNRGESGRFAGVPVKILESQEYANLSSRAVKLLIDLTAQYNGYNNGDLCATWSMMVKRGWKSRDTLAKATKELLLSGFILKTRQGQKGSMSGDRKPTLYAITWKGIDECNGKLDIPSSPVPKNTWSENKCSARLAG